MIYEANTNHEQLLTPEEVREPVLDNAIGAIGRAMITRYWAPVYRDAANADPTSLEFVQDLGYKVMPVEQAAVSVGAVIGNNVSLQTDPGNDIDAEKELAGAAA
jgi:hypothetical protein